MSESTETPVEPVVESTNEHVTETLVEQESTETLVEQESTKEPGEESDGSSVCNCDDCPEEKDPLADVVEKDVNMEKLQPEVDQLSHLLEQLKTMDPKDRNQLMANMVSQNSINPNNMQFSSASRKEMLKEKLRQKINSKRINRTSNRAKENQLKKKQLAHEKRLEELKKLKEATSANTESDNDEQEPKIVEDAEETVTLVEEVLETPE